MSLQPEIIPDLPTSKITGLDTALAGKAVSSHTHSASEVTGTALTQGDLTSELPLVASGTGAAGTSTDVARADHVHPAQTFTGATVLQGGTKIKSGTVSLSQESSTSVNSASVSFTGTAFGTAPVILVSVQYDRGTTSPYSVPTALIKTRSTSQFTVDVFWEVSNGGFQSTAMACTVHWVAIGT